ncbi:flagellar basal body-associated FliL family protein [Yunchengibacter salinarum]|uniref:flagellar basal body-associated FliL family protein n=1 Tax=Yunchengibacter salinarum TaxID=3133399 RepID=UPI0035B69912
MADENDIDEAREDASALSEDDLTEGLERKKFSGKKVVIFGGAAAVVLLILILVVSLLSGGEEKPEGDPELNRMAEEQAEKQAAEQAKANKPPEKKELLFHTLPDQLYNLNTEGEGSSFLRARITLELDRPSFKADIEKKMPRILDEFNTYMRELRPQDLEGSSGIFRLKEELLMRINQAVAPTRVNDILFEEFLVQG